MKIEQFKVKNQFIIEDNEGNIYFQSYDSIIALFDVNCNIYLDYKYWDYSKTTTKYRNMFLNMTTKEIKEKIKSGEIKFKNLN